MGAERIFRLGWATAWAAALLAVAAPAEAEPTVTTRDLAACAADADRPICLLRVLSAASPLPYRNRPEFAAAPAVLALIEAPAAIAPETETSRTYYEHMVRPHLQAQEAVLAALETDRQGRPPEAALAPIAELGRGVPRRVMGLGQIVSPSAADLQLGAYRSVWAAFDRAKGQEKQPSRALARLALDRWAEVLVRDRADLREPSSFYGAGLPEAYAKLGDEVAARRAAGALRETPGGAEVRVLTAFGRLDEATARAEAQESAPFERDGVSDLDPVRRRLLLAVLIAGRDDLAVRISEARLASALNAPTDIDNVFAAPDREAPLAILATHRGPEAAAAWAQKFEAASARPRAVRPEISAAWAAQAWARAGRPDKARAVAAAWASRAEGSWSVGRAVQAMWLWAGDDEAAWRLGLITVTQLVEFDVLHGRGLARLDAHLAHGNELQVDGALGACAEQAGRERDWASARACVERLAARADRPLSEQERALAEKNRALGIPPRLDFPTARGEALVAAFRLAAAAVHDQPALAHDMADLALALAGGEPALELDFRLTPEIDSFATRALRAAGRL